MFGDTLKELRIQKNLSQKQLADILHLHKSTICHLEANNRKASWDVMLSIANFFHTSTDYLLGKSDRTLDVSSLTDEQVAVVEQMVSVLQQSNQQHA